jgi:hypothetical protein
MTRRGPTDVEEGAVVAAGVVQVRQQGVHTVVVAWLVGGRQRWGGSQAGAAANAARPRRAPPLWMLHASGWSP